MRAGRSGVVVLSNDPRRGNSVAPPSDTRRGCAPPAPSDARRCCSMVGGITIRAGETEGAGDGGPDWAGEVGGFGEAGGRGVEGGESRGDDGAAGAVEWQAGVAAAEPFSSRGSGKPCPPIPASASDGVTELRRLSSMSLIGLYLRTGRQWCTRVANAVWMGRN